MMNRRAEALLMDRDKSTNDGQKKDGRRTEAAMKNRSSKDGQKGRSTHETSSNNGQKQKRWKVVVILDKSSKNGQKME